MPTRAPPPALPVISAREISPGLGASLRESPSRFRPSAPSIRCALRLPAAVAGCSAILGLPTALAHPLALLVAFGPLVLSFATLLLPLGRLAVDAAERRTQRPPQRERLIYEDALAVLAQADPDLRPPRRWFVLDDAQPERRRLRGHADAHPGTAWRAASSQPVLAHELGHLNSSDARLTAALHRLTTAAAPPTALPAAHARLPCRSGALGVWVTRTPWAAYWRAREFAADQYAATLGQGPALARFLDTDALEDDLPVPFRWLSRASHPADRAPHRPPRRQRLD